MFCLKSLEEKKYGDSDCFLFARADVDFICSDLLLPNLFRHIFLMLFLFSWLLMTFPVSLISFFVMHLVTSALERRYRNELVIVLQTALMNVRNGVRTLALT